MQRNSYETIVIAPFCYFPPSLYLSCAILLEKSLLGTPVVVATRLNANAGNLVYFRIRDQWI